MVMDALDRIATLNPITFLKSMVTVNRSASGEYHKSTLSTPVQPILTAKS